LDYVPLAFVTAKESKNVFRVLNLAQSLAKQARTRVGTGELNRVIRTALEANPPSQKGTKMPKILFASQVAIEPPTIVFFTNGPDLFDSIYRKYLTKVFREQLPFPEVALKMDFRSRHDQRPRDRETGEQLAEAGDLPSVPTPEAPKKKQDVTAPKKRKKGDKSTLWDI
jgi:GTPase